MHEYRWAIAFIAITFLLLAIADMHRTTLSGGCYNAEGQLVACDSLSKPRTTQTPAPSSSGALVPTQGIILFRQVWRSPQAGTTAQPTSGH